MARTDVAAPQNKAPAGLSNKQPPGGHHAAQQTPNLRRPPAPGGVRGGSEAQEEGQVHGVGDADLIQVHGGGDEGQVDGEEVAGVHQQLAGPPLLLLLQSFLQRDTAPGGKMGTTKLGQSLGVRSPLTSTLLMKSGLTRSSSPAAGVYARRIFTTWKGHQGSSVTPLPQIPAPGGDPNSPPGYLLRGQHGAEAADGPGILLRRLLHLQQLGSLHQWLQHLAGSAVLQPLRPQPLLQLADVVPAVTKGGQGDAPTASRPPQNALRARGGTNLSWMPRVQEQASFLSSR